MLNSFKTNERELRTMIENLKKTNDDLKSRYNIGELQSLKENHIIAKQELEQAKREMYQMRDEVLKASYERDSHQREVANLNEKVNDLAAGKRKADQKLEALTEQVDKLQTNLKR